MSDQSLADLAREYEDNARILERQIAKINTELRHCFGHNQSELTRKRVILEDMLCESRAIAHKLKTYYKK